MGKSKTIPLVEDLDVAKQNETINAFRELGLKFPEIAVIGVHGPYETEAYTERKSRLGYDCGLPYACVGIGVDQTLQEQLLSPLEKTQEVLEIIERLHRAGIGVSLSVITMKEPGNYMNQKRVLQYIFGPLITEVKEAYIR